MATETIRELAVEALVARIQGIVKTNIPTGPTVQSTDVYGYDFSTGNVWREPPETLTQGKIAAAVVLEQTETKRELSWPTVECELTVYIEVHVMRDVNESMSQKINRYLGVVERCIRSDRTISGTCWDCTILGSETTPEGPYKTYGAGVTRVVLKYRHHTSDPRLTVKGS